MLTFFTDSVERTKYKELLSGDIYSRIGQEMEINDRERVKKDFQRVVNIGYKTPDWMARQYVFQFYYEHFPIFAVEVLFKRTDLASSLQNLEARLMVQKVGTFCRENSLFWVPMHDGFIGRIDQGDLISNHVKKIIQETVGLIPEIECTPISTYPSIPRTL